MLKGMVLLQLSGTEPPSKEYARAGPALPPTPPAPTYVANVQLGLHVGLLTSRAGALSVSAPSHWIPLPLPGTAWLGLSGRGCALSCSGLRCQGGLVSEEGVSLLRGEGERKWGGV